MGWGDIFAGGAAAGGRITGLGLILWTAFQTFKFLCNFIAGRQDARQARLEALDVRLTTSLGKRLTHLEAAEAANQSRIRLLEEVVAILTAELRSENPNNPKLKEVGRMLANVTPLPIPDPELDELMRHAGNAVDRSQP